jgi:SapC
MPKWTALSSGEHAAHYWRPRENYAFAASMQVIEIFMQELSLLLPYYAFGFTINPQNKKFQMVALLSLGGEKNLYIDKQEQWWCKEVPAALQSYPFSVASGPQDERVICIDESHLTLEPNENPLYNSAETLSEKVVSVVEALSKMDADRQRTQNAVDALATAELIESWPLTVNGGESEGGTTIAGLYRINEAALNELARSDFNKLRASGALVLAYAQLFSTNQIRQLGERAELRARHLEHEAQSSKHVDSLFDSGGTLNFDNI